MATFIRGVALTDGDEASVELGACLPMLDLRCAGWLTPVVLLPGGPVHAAIVGPALCLGAVWCPLEARLDVAGDAVLTVGLLVAPPSEPPLSWALVTGRVNTPIGSVAID